MQAIASALRRLLIVVCLLAVAWAVVANYSVVFSKKVRGEVLEVERMNQPSAIIGGAPMTAEQMFSFAVMIKSFDGKIYSSSSEDRQWAIAKKGYCVETRLFPYPPWNFEKDGTFFNARLVSVFECKSEAPPGWTPGFNAPSASEKASASSPVAPPGAPANALAAPEVKPGSGPDSGPDSGRGATGHQTTKK